MEKEIAILFDCDGVLVDSEPALAQVAADVLQKNNIPAKPEDFAPYIGTGEDVYLGKVVEKYGFVHTEEIKDQVYQSYIEHASEFVETFPGCLSFLEQLKKSDIKMAVASSADLVKVNANLSALGFKEFDAVITGTDIHRKKPYPDIYLLAAEKINVKPENCIVIEDATSGVKSGKAAGMTVIGFTSACSREELLAAGADYVADSYQEIGQIVFESKIV